MIPGKGFTVWFTGLSGSGKSTISSLVHHLLQDAGITNVEVLDGEALHSHLFTREDTETNTHRIGWVAHILTKQRIPNLVAAVSPYRGARDEARRMIEGVGGDGSFIEVFVDCPPEVCRARSVKTVEATDAEYEPPHSPEVVIKTDRVAPNDAARKVMEYLKESGLIEAGEGR